MKQEDMLVLLVVFVLGFVVSRMMMVVWLNRLTLREFGVM